MTSDGTSKSKPVKVPLKKLKSGFAMPVYGLGTWGFGGAYERDESRDSADIDSIQSALHKGVTHIDTAELYGAGHTEEIIGQAIRSFDRSTLFIATKAWWTHMRADDLRKACEESLRRVGTSYFDLYLLHRRVPEVPLKETMQAMNRLADEGMIREIGVSNFGVAALKEAQALSSRKIVCNQVHYNLEFREPESAGLLSFCQEQDMFLSAFRPVQKGALMANPSKIVQEMCEKYGKTSAQIAINWLVSQKNVVTIAKTAREAHLEENLGALDFAMDDSDIERLGREYPNQQKTSNSVPLG